MNGKLEKKVFEWIKADAKNAVDAVGEYYCETRDRFQARLDSRHITFICELN